MPKYIKYISNKVEITSIVNQLHLNQNSVVKILTSKHFIVILGCIFVSILIIHMLFI